MGWVAYIIVCILWGLFTCRMHKKLNRPKQWHGALPLYGALPLLFLMNAIGAPISLIIAIANCPIKVRENEKETK